MHTWRLRTLRLWNLELLFEIEGIEIEGIKIEVIEIKDLEVNDMKWKTLEPKYKF